MIDFDDVYEVERAYIEERRKAVKDDRCAPLPETPSTEANLVGVALSGGGVRSATLALGVLQALNRYGLFRHVDLLSTVSGGGFLGSAVTANMSRGDGVTMPFDTEQPEGRARVAHLRAHSSYLTPGGLLDYPEMAVVLVRGMMLNLLVMVPHMLLFCAASITVFGEMVQERFEYDEHVDELGNVLKDVYGARMPEDQRVDDLFEILRRDSILAPDVRRHTFVDALDGTDRRWSMIDGADSEAMPLVFRPELYTPRIAARLMAHDLVRRAGETEEIAVVANALCDTSGSDITVSHPMIDPGNITIGDPLDFVMDGQGFDPVAELRRLNPSEADLARELYERRWIDPDWLHNQFYCCTPGTLGCRAETCRRSDRRCPPPGELQRREAYEKTQDPACHFVHYPHLDSEDAGLLLGNASPPWPAWDPYAPNLHYTVLLLGFVVLWVLAFPLVSMLMGSLSTRVRRRTDSMAEFFHPIVTRYDSTFALLGLLIGIVAALELLPYLVYHFHARQVLLSADISVGLSVISLVGSALSGPLFSLLQRTGRWMLLGVFAFLMPILPLVVYLQLMDIFLFAGPGDVIYSLPWLSTAIDSAGEVSRTLSVFVLLFWMCIFFVIARLIDVNGTSLHRFYRDRLAKAYLLLDTPDTTPKPIPLNEVCPEGSGAPYHVINGALNLQASNAAEVTDRMSDFFEFSRSFVGSDRTGYCRTAALAAALPELRLDSAIAVSGAAAAPAMGVYSSRTTGFWMTLLNLRMGFWLPHPSYVNRWYESAPSTRGAKIMQALRKLRMRPHGGLLLRELFGMVHELGPRVNISDGGHIENSGAYALLRRRCRFIIIVDGEADPDYSFGSLASLVRYARLDLDVEIDIDLEPMRPNAEGMSARHGAVGRIEYPAANGAPEQHGVLVYLKSSVTGDEDEMITHYDRTNQTFPHETTADQFFDEVQFEAYRALGFHIAQGLFPRDAHQVRDHLRSFADVERWFEGLSIQLTPSLESLDLGGVAALQTQIDEALQAEGLAGFLAELHPDLGEAPPVDLGDPEVCRKVFSVCSMQLKLMQMIFYSVALDEAVDRHHPSARGWINLFRMWAASPTFCFGYMQQVGTLGRRFSAFADDVLGMRIELVWRTQRENDPMDRLDPIEGLTQPPLILTCSMPETPTLVIGQGSAPGDGPRRLTILPKYDNGKLRERARQALTDDVGPPQV